MLTLGERAPRPPRRVVVLGAGGFLGGRLARRLGEAGIETLGLGRADIDLAAADGAAELATRLRPDDALVLAAALTPRRPSDPGALVADLAMARAVALALDAKPVAHLVYLSCEAVYPAGAGLISEATPAAADEPCGVMHRAREVLLRAQARWPLAVIRPCAVYGGGDPHDAYGPSRFLRELAMFGRATLDGDGEDTAEHLHVDDLAEALRLCLVHRAAGLVNVATGAPVSVRAAAEAAAAALDLPPVFAHAPRRGPPTHRSFDLAALHKSFPDFFPRPLEEGLAEAAAALRAAGGGR